MMFKNFYKNKYNSKLSTVAGLTLVELLVVISIFTIITGITIFNYGRFDSSVSTQNLADDIALTVRRAQGYAVGVHGFENTDINGYGVHFTADTTSNSFSGSNKAFILFADIKDGTPVTLSNKKYDDSPTSCGYPEGIPLLGNECIEILSILSADEVSEISLNMNNSSTFDLMPQVSSIDIVFKRPNPEPTFCYRKEVSDDCTVDITAVKIKISSENNPDSLVNRYITISNTGQISVSIK